MCFCYNLQWNHLAFFQAAQMLCGKAKLLVLMLLVSIIGHHDLVAQNPEAEIAALFQKTMEQEQFRSDVKIEVFASHDATEPTINQSCQIRKKGNKWFYQVGQTRLLVSEKKVLIINDKSKMVMVRQEGAAALKKSLDQKLGKFIPESEKDISIQKENVKGQWRYALQMEDALIQTAYFYPNESDQTIERVEYYYDPELTEGQSKVVVSYQIPNAPDDSQLFSERAYIKKGKNGLEGVASCSHYQVMEQNQE